MLLCLYFDALMSWETNPISKMGSFDGVFDRSLAFPELFPFIARVF